MQSEAIVRSARPEDADALLACARAFHDGDNHPLRPSGVAALRALVADDSADGRVFVLEHRGVVSGYVTICFGYSVEYGGRDAFIDDIYVAAPLRGRGYGTKLYDAALAGAHAEGCYALHLEVKAGSRTAAWYVRLGFRDRGNVMMSMRLAGD